MPELPEVETMVRGIRPLMEGAKILELRACPCERKPLEISPPISRFQDQVRNVTIVSVDRLAKRIVIRLASHDHIVFEPRMTGLALISDPPSQEHLRFQFCLSRGKNRASVWIWDRRGLGTLSLFSETDFKKTLGNGALGTDALAITVDELMTQLKQTNRPIKVALMDQKLVAGIGNLYASEILHQAQVHPETVSARLSQRQILKIHTVMNLILQEAIRYEGSTLNDGTYRNALNKNGSYQNQHKVYGKSDTICSTCKKEKIRRIVQAQRSTFYCPHCQKQPRSTGI